MCSSHRWTHDVCASWALRFRFKQTLNSIDPLYCSRMSVQLSFTYLSSCCHVSVFRTESWVGRSGRREKRRAEPEVMGVVQPIRRRRGSQVTCRTDTVGKLEVQEIWLLWFPFLIPELWRRANRPQRKNNKNYNITGRVNHSKYYLSGRGVPQ